MRRRAKPATVKLGGHCDNEEGYDDSEDDSVLLGFISRAASSPFFAR